MHGNSLIMSAEIFSELEEVSPLGELLPQKEKHVRPLARLETQSEQAVILVISCHG